MISEAEKRGLFTPIRGAKPPKYCPGCDKFYAANSGIVTRHHLTPKAEEPVAGNHNAKTMPLCQNCHSMVHQLLGGGDNYNGPRNEQKLIQWIRVQYESMVQVR